MTGFVLVCISIVFGGFSVEAVNTLVWETKSQRDFSKGEPDGVSVTSEGDVVLSPQLKPVLNTEDKELFVWALVRDSAENFYAATGNNGRLFKISGDGASSLFFDSPEISILSLAVDTQDNIYAGSSPDGVIYKINPQGAHQTFFNTGEAYVWALAVSTNGEVFAATGNKGRIYKISQDGKGLLLFDSGQAHITVLLPDGQGSFYAGSEGDGIVYRVSAEGKVSVLYDAEENEIRNLVLDRQGNLYVTALASRSTAPLPRDKRSPEEKEPPKEKRNIKNSGIYKITPEGAVSKIWNSPSNFIYAMIAGKDNTLLIGTDDRGMVYKISSEGDSTALFRTEKAQVLSFLQGANSDLYLGTGDTAAVYKVDFNSRETGTLLSLAHDTQGISKWGKISWKGSSQGIKFLTRTGNTEKPDSTWSPWSGEYLDRTGTDITNPPARFIQWKLILTTVPGEESPVLKEVTVAYLPKNLNPRIHRITTTSFREDVSPPPTSRESRKSDEREEKGEEKGNSLPPGPGRSGSGFRPPRPTEKGKKVISWVAEDPNNDILAYDLYFRGEGEKTWKPIDEDLHDPSYVLDTESLPDGWYEVKVVASDTPSNPSDKALKTEKVSEPVLIDNTPPVVKMISTQRENSTGKFMVSVQAIDSASALRLAQYSVDVEAWEMIFPKDEIFDSKEEEFMISLSDLPAGEHTLVFKVMDSAGNVGAGKTVIQSP